MKNGEEKPHKPERTPAQKQALRDAYKLLASQFDHFLMVCGMEMDQETIGPDMDVYWKGGYLMANSMADLAKDKIRYQKRFNVTPA